MDVATDLTENNAESWRAHELAALAQLQRDRDMRPASFTRRGRATALDVRINALLVVIAGYVRSDYRDSDGEHREFRSRYR